MTKPLIWVTKTTSASPVCVCGWGIQSGSVCVWLFQSTSFRDKIFHLNIGFLLSNPTLFTVSRYKNLVTSLSHSEVALSLLSQCMLWRNEFIHLLLQLSISMQQTILKKIVAFKTTKTLYCGTHFCKLTGMDRVAFPTCRMLIADTWRPDRAGASRVVHTPGTDYVSW